MSTLHSQTQINTEIKNLVRTYAKEKQILREYSIDSFSYGKSMLRYTARVAYSSNTVSGRSGYGFGVSNNKSKAILKALVEALERYFSGEYFSTCAGALASLSNAIDPRKIYSYKPGSIKKNFPKFNPQKQYRWVTATQLKTGQPALTLCDQVFYPVNKNHLGYQPLYKANSSGVSAFRNKTGALLRGLLELIERDAIALAWYTNHEVEKLSAKYISKKTHLKISFWEKQGYKIHFYNFSVDTVPVVVCFIFHKTKYPFFTCGARASFSAAESVEKALDEAEDVLFALRSEKEQKIFLRDIHSPADHARYYAQRKNALTILSFLNVVKKRKPKIYKKWDIKKLIEHFDPIVVSLHTSKYCHAVRVLSQKLLPLNFGYGMEPYRHERIPSLGLTEKKNYRPHFFP